MSLPMPQMETCRARGSRQTLAYFVLASLLLHALVVTLWRGEPPAGPTGSGTLQVTLLARPGDSAGRSDSGAVPAAAEDSQASESPAATSAADDSTVIENAKLTSLPATDTAARQRFVTLPANNKYRPDAGARTAPGTTPPPQPNAQAPGDLQQQKLLTSNDAQSQARGPARARRGTAGRGQHALSSEAKSDRVRAALYEALLPHFEYPPLARRRGWQGRVRVGLHVESDGDLRDVHLVESSGYALLDKAAVRDLSELRNVPGAAQWLNGRGMELILPVRYRLYEP